ncbi:hypothetical protein K0I73_10665 [Shewanella mesophila]|uniref:hypothetical protein n=1 Tax=Shewanella mesophila TaxID=2864208 RepID=UPI001C657BF3|nr:hypothetical protein [Shewanella mesophila]QYJ84729.1 hypothetical protein K0I73_10665 [Shewanella mesophila]
MSSINNGNRIRQSANNNMQMLISLARSRRTKGYFDLLSQSRGLFNQYDKKETRVIKNQTDKNKNATARECIVAFLKQDKG